MVNIDGQSDVTRHGRTSKYTVQGFADTQTIHLNSGTVSTETAFMLVDISDTTNWKHTNTDHIIIDHIFININPGTSYRGNIGIGFLSNVDATNGDLNDILDIDMTQQAAEVVQDIEFGGGFHCQVSTHFGPITANSTLFQTDVDLGGPDDPATGTYPSGDGDLVLLVGRTAGDVDVSVTIIYETVGS